jgi:8-oxo-dGTP diphosphatase
MLTQIADGPLVLFERQVVPEHGREKTYFFGSTVATQSDVVLGEGAAMVFTRPSELLDQRVYTPGTREVLTRFLASTTYADLVGFTPKG